MKPPTSSVTFGDSFSSRRSLATTDSCVILSERSESKNLFFVDIKMDNYEITLQNAMKRFCSYDIAVLSQKPGVMDGGEHLRTRFFGMETLISKKSGEITVNGEKADFCEALSVFDWLCDGKADAKASGGYAPVSSLPGVFVRGSGLMMKSPELAEAIEKKPDAFRNVCLQLGGKTVDIGDIGVEIPIFPDLFMMLKFYFGDEEFPPDITFLWDENILQFVRYETVYYIAGTLKKHLLQCLHP